MIHVGTDSKIDYWHIIGKGC